MCLAIPAIIVAVDGEEAVVEVSGVRLRSNVSFISDAKVGDCVLLHAGFAIRKWSEQDLRQYNEIMKGMSLVHDDTKDS